MQFVEMCSNFHFQKQLKRYLTMSMERIFYTVSHFVEQNGVVPIDLISAER